MAVHNVKKAMLSIGGAETLFLNMATTEARQKATKYAKTCLKGFYDEHNFGGIFS